MQRFIAELQRRNVHRAAVFYAGASWLLMQVATQVLPVFDIAAPVQRLIVLALIAGFPFAMLFSWFYEWTPEGIRRESEVDRSASVTQQTGRRMDRGIIALLALAVVVLLAGRFVLPKPAPAPAVAVATAATADRSIAVLPFENLSDDKSNAYFASGIQDEILTRLAKIGALKVISRTSTAHYASSPDNLPEIARQLGVANILEGSVQKAGDAVHVNVQLIRAVTDDHLWAESYNRKLDDIFGVEGEVAGAIAEQLNAQLSGAERQAVTDRSTDNPAAYDAYLRGIALGRDNYDLTVWRKAADAFAEAVRLDPRFAVAWARLSITQGYLYFNGIEPASTAESVRRAAETALRLQPQLGEAQLAQGYYRYRVLRDFAGAQRAFETSLQGLPNDPLLWEALGLVERRQGQWEAALKHLQQAAELDPRNAGLMVTIGGETLANMRRYDEARLWLDRSLALSPDNVLALSYKAASYQVEGRLEDAARLLDPIPAAGIDPGIALQRSYQRLLEHRFEAAIAELQPLMAQPDDTLNGLGRQLAINLGFAQLDAGQAGAARMTFERLIAGAKGLDSDRADDALGPVMLALAYAGAGQPQVALAQARRAVELYRSDAILLPSAEAALAQVEALGGAREAALSTIGRLLKMPAGITPAQLRLDPVWDSLRSDVRFQKLIAAGPSSTPLSAR